MSLDYCELRFELEHCAKDEFEVRHQFYSEQSRDSWFWDLPHPRISIPFAKLLSLAGIDNQYAQALSDAFFSHKNIKDAFDKAIIYADGAKTKLRVRLCLPLNYPDVHQVRWELLYIPSTTNFIGLSEKILFSRYIKTDSTDPLPIKELDSHQLDNLKALMVVSGSSGNENLAPIAVADEVNRLQQSLKGVKATVLASGSQIVNIPNIINALRDKPDIMIILAHGSITDNEPYLWLEDEQGEPNWIRGSEFAQRIKASHSQPALVVLASCQSASNQSDTALRAIGPYLAKLGVPAVLAIQGDIRISSIQAFLPQFFTELWRYGLVDRALAAARLELHNTTDWWRPILFLRVPDGRIWKLPTIPHPPSNQVLLIENFIGRSDILISASTTIQKTGSLLITGLSGIGKTSLAKQLVNTFGIDIFWCEAPKLPTGEDVIRSLAGFLFHLGFRDLWSILQTPPLPPVHEQIAYLITLLAKAPPVIVVIDDIGVEQERERGFIDLLTALFRASQQGRIKLLLTSRKLLPTAFDNIERLVLEGLQTPEAAVLLADSKISHDPDLLDKLCQQISGNPQLLLLAAKSLQDKDANPQHLIDDLMTEDHIERYLLEKVDQTLSETERNTMRPLSVLAEYGGSVDVIEFLTAITDVWPVLRALSDYHLVYQRPSPRKGKDYYQHRILQAFYYEHLVQQRRQELHRRAAQYYIEQEDQPLYAIWHLIRARNYTQVATMVSDYYQKALDSGQGSYLLQLMLMKEVGNDKIPLSQRLEWCVIKGELAAWSRDSVTAQKAFEDALDPVYEHHSSAPVLRARAYCGIAEVLEFTEPQTALQRLQEGLSEYTGSSYTREEARLLRRLGSVYIALGELSEAEPSLRRSLELLPRTDVVIRADVFLNLGIIACMNGDMQEGEQLFQEALKLYERAKQPRLALGVKQNLINIYELVGDWQRAASQYPEALTQAKELGAVVRELELRLNFANLRIRQGDFTNTATELENLRNQAEELSLNTNSLLIYGSLGDLHTRQGNWDAAETALQAGLKLAEKLNSQESLPEFYRIQATILLHRKEFVAALQVADQAIEAAQANSDQSGEGMGLRIKGLILLANQQVTEAITCFRASCDFLETEPYEHARTLGYWAQVIASTEPFQSQTLRQKAQETFQQLGALHDLALLDTLFTSAN